MNKSRKVSEEAERFEAIMRFNIFREEQELQLWGYREDTDWVPGVPIYNRPKGLTVGQQVVRPMIDLLSVEAPWYIVSEFTIDNHCKDCDVAWDGIEACFVCGAYPKKINWRGRPTTNSRGETFWVDDYDQESSFEARMMQFETYEITFGTQTLYQAMGVFSQESEQAE